MPDIDADSHIYAKLISGDERTCQAVNGAIDGLADGAVDVTFAEEPLPDTLFDESGAVSVLIYSKRA